MTGARLQKHLLGGPNALAQMFALGPRLGVTVQGALETDFGPSPSKSCPLVSERWCQHLLSKDLAKTWISLELLSQGMSICCRCVRPCRAILMAAKASPDLWTADDH